MPPKNKEPAGKKPKQFESTIDPKRHEAKLHEIEESHRLQQELIEEEEEELGEEEMSEEEEEGPEIWSEYEWSPDLGRIDLSFPEKATEFADSPLCYPPSYYTLSAKERLLLLYAENFRRQFNINYAKRRPLVLAVPNECDVQACGGLTPPGNKVYLMGFGTKFCHPLKFVCSTIRPTAFCHLPLICSTDGCASFVADSIIYEPLEDMMSLPTRLVSPTTLLLKRRGNSFEIATLLCSMLIGAGFPAMVVSGVAREATVLNDQRNVEYPHKIVESAATEEGKSQQMTGMKYKLRPMPDLQSHLEENLQAIRRQKEEEEQRIRDEAERLVREEYELRAVDRYHYRRCHAWVVIIDNAPWSNKPLKQHVDEDGNVVGEPLKARFIEPTTGFECDTKTIQYILVDSVWNDYNYYVNLQKYQRISEIRWDLQNITDWEHLLPGEPPQMRQYKITSDENVAETERDVEEEKHLDTIGCWVMKPFIGVKMFEERFPRLEKTVKYKRAIHERFSPYTQPDGKVMQLTIFADDDYQEAVTRWEFYENRADRFEQVKFTYETSQKQETFRKGRNDSLKFMDYNVDPSKPKFLYFYSVCRLDCMEYLEIQTDKLLLRFHERNDLCVYLEFEFKPAVQTLKKITEKFNRNLLSDKPAYKDIAARTFFLSQRKILLKFHYARGALTSNTIEFTKPPKPDYGQQIKYDPGLTKLYKANADDPDFTPLELYRLLLAQLQYEEKIKKHFEKIMDEINTILDARKLEVLQPVLSFNIFDPLRNGAARALHLQQHAEEEAFKREVASKPADFLAPYLVSYKKRLLTYEESWAAYNACLHDLKTRFVTVLNNLQRQYEDLTTESKSLKLFLKKFENQFNNEEYERLVGDAKNIELNKRMVQQALEQTHEDSQKKYESVKASLMKDERLNLKKKA